MATEIKNIFIEQGELRMYRLMATFVDKLFNHRFTKANAKAIRSLTKLMLEIFNRDMFIDLMYDREPKKQLWQKSSGEFFIDDKPHKKKVAKHT